jgi:DUF1680 family protein
MENHAKYGDSIYFHDDDALYINLFIASELHWRERRLRVAQITRFPDEEATELILRMKAPVSMKLKIRHPAWCRRATVTINGRAHDADKQPGGYIEIERTWQDRDIVKVELPMRLRLETLPGTPDIAALMYGPIVLAGRLGTEGLTTGADILVNERTSGEMLNIPLELPRLELSERTLQEKVRRKADERLAFSVKALQPERELELIPYHRIAHERYNLYWQLTPEHPRS